MQFTDRMAVTDGLKRMADGYLSLTARVARGGNVQDYRGDEIGQPEKAIVRVYRPEAEVFRKDAIKTYAGVPVTLGHPKDGVSADTWKDHAVGEVGDEVLRDGEFVRVPMTLRDAKAIAAVEAGTRELSMGYSAEIALQDGVSPAGEKFDAVMSGFRMNHVAIVPVARGGSDLRIGDGADSWGASPVHDAGKEVPMTLRNIMVDGLSVETTDAGAQAIDKLTKVIAAKDAKIAANDAEHAKEIAAKDAAIAKAEGERDAANAKVLDAAAIDKMVADRATLVAKAVAIAPGVKTAGLADADIRKAVVLAKLGDAMKDKPAAYIDARFDILAEDAKVDDPVAKALLDGKPVLDVKGEADKARADHLQSLRDGWKQPAVKH